MNKFLNSIHKGFDKIKTFAATRKGKITLSVTGCAVVALIITGIVAGSIPQNNAVAAGTSSEEITPVSSASSEVSSDETSVPSADSSANAASSTSTPLSEVSPATTAPTTTTVTQAAVAVTDISITKSSITVAQGATYQLSAVITPDNASDKTLNWTSTNTSVATVDGNGIVTGKAAGSATIHASGANGHKGTCKITVKAPSTGNGDQDAGGDTPTPSPGPSPAPADDDVNNNTNDGVPEGYRGTKTSFTVQDEVNPGVTQTLSFLGCGAKHNGKLVLESAGGTLNTTDSNFQKYGGQTVTITLSGGQTYSDMLFNGLGFTDGGKTNSGFTAGRYTIILTAANGTKLAQISFRVDSKGMPSA